jgi:Thiamine biosynthesis protein ThiC
MKEPVISTDSLDPDYADSEEKNLRKSPAGRSPAKAAAQSADESSSLPNSRKVYISGKIHPDIRVPFREISLAPTKTMSGEIEVNEPVRVYDTSGPWGDPTVMVDAYQGLPALRRKWILARGDVEEINGRKVQPIDDGWLSEKHRISASPARTAERRTSNSESGDGNARPARTSGFRFQDSGWRKPLRAKYGSAVTQLYYARNGVVTPEMEFIALRENSGPAAASRTPT